MENKIHFYTSRKNVLTWLIAISMLCSVVARVAFADMERISLWSQIILPSAASVLFASILLLWGKEQFFKTAISVWLYFGYFAFAFFRFNFRHYDTMIGILFAICLVFLATLYTRITSGKRTAVALLIPVAALPLGAWLYMHRGEVFPLAWETLQPYIPDVLMTAGLVLLPFIMRVHPVGGYHPSWGDRPDGRRLRTLDPMSQVAPYIMVNRTGCVNLLEESFEITNLERFVRMMRKNGMPKLGLMHMLLAAYCRGISKYPGLNRFISGQKVFTHGEDIQFCMVVKKEMSTEGEETIIKLHLTPRDTLQQVYEKFDAAVEEAKATPLESTFDNVAQLFTLIPGVLLKFAVWFLKTLDYFGLLPGFLLEVSPFHGSVFFTSMGSLGIPPVYHHLYDFGNLPVFASFGCKRRALEVLEDGTVVQRKYLDCRFTVEDRTVDGFYYASFLKYYKRLLAHPELLLTPPEEVVQDIE